MKGRSGTLNAGAWGVVLVLAAAVSCGAEKTDDGAAPRAGEKSAAAPVAKTEAPNAAPAEGSGGLKIDGVATVIAESTPGAESPLRLVIGEAGRLAGSLSVGGSECTVSGMVDDAVVRGWLQCPNAAKGAPPRRGTLLGEKAGESYSGTFAISDDGAATVLNGTWKAGK
jgi:hypothetical protein